MTVLIVMLAVLAGAGCWIGAARTLYARWRPSSLPVSCNTPTSCSRAFNGKHYNSCYARVDLIDTKTEAAVLALLGGLLWPVVLPVLGLAFLVRFRQPETREELEARIAELEREAGIG